MPSPSPESTSPAERAAKETIIKSMLYHMLLEKRLVPPKALGIPLKQLYPKDWNWCFEKAYLDKYGPNCNLDAWKRENEDVGGLAREYLRDLRGCTLEIARTSKMLLVAEGLLVAQAIEQLVDGDFETKWAALEGEKKKKIVLDGLVRGAYNAREKSRFDCPETSLFDLIGDGEYNLINLLKTVVAHDPIGNFRVKSLYLFSHPAVEREYAYINDETNTPDDLRAAGYLRIIQRNQYIVQALLGILDSYIGKPPKVYLHADIDDARCYGCGTVEKNEVAFKKCNGCQLVSYCSTDCQQRDLREHKKLCGPNLNLPRKFDPAFVTATPDPEPRTDFIGCPVSVEGFVRSPALWRQIGYLSKKDSYARDYHFDIGPDHSRSIRIPDPALRTMFLIARRRAMASGDRAAVYKMHDILALSQHANLLSLTPTQIKNQLQREYRVALDPPVGFGAPPTEQEMDEEIAFADRRDRLALVRGIWEGEGTFTEGLCPCCLYEAMWGESEPESDEESDGDSESATDDEDESETVKDSDAESDDGTGEGDQSETAVDSNAGSVDGPKDEEEKKKEEGGEGKVRSKHERKKEELADDDETPRRCFGWFFR